MHEFEIWAPNVKRVQLQVGQSSYPMVGPDSQGKCKATVEQAQAGMDYALVLDEDTTAYPDPRSPWQPHGVHGPSRLYDHSAFEWHDEKWQGPPFAGAVVYELHVGTFTPEGTFDAAITKLDYLHELGITHVELMPVAAFSGEHGWGYDGVALYAVADIYGGPDGLKRLVDACHVKCLGVLLDVVYNHFGPVGNYTSKFGPYTTEKHCTPWGPAMNFEERGSDEVRRFFIDNALMWMRDYHLDGLRLDAVHEFVDRSAIHFMEQMSAEVEVLSATVGRRLMLIAESDLNDPKIVRPREAGGYGMDAQWSDDFHHALFTLLHVEEEGKGYYDDFGSMEYLAKSLSRMFVYDGAYSIYRGRSHGRPVDSLSAHRFIGFIQNHDQVGNRATGDRLEHIIGLARTKVAMGIVLMAPFLPMLFQGEEYAASTPFQYFADHEDPEMAKAVSEGRKREFAAFGWDPAVIPDPEKRETFERSKLNWDEVHEGAHAEMLEWTRALIHLRRGSVSLNDGDTGHTLVQFDEHKLWLSMRRGDVLVILNLGEETVELSNPDGLPIRLASGDGIEIIEGGVRVAPDRLAVLARENG